MAEPARRLLTVEDFLEQTDGSEREELRHGSPVAMAPTLSGHQILAARVGRRLDEALDARPGCTVRSEAAIAPFGLDSDRLHIADLAVTCVPGLPRDRLTAEPVLVVEILSESTEAYDRRVKLPDYRTMPSVAEILFIDPTRMFAEVHRRFEGDRWLVDLLRRPEDELRLDSVGLRIPLGDLYERVPLEPQPD